MKTQTNFNAVRCKHGMIQDQCGDCKHLPPYVENPPPDLIRNTNSNMPDENPPVVTNPKIIKEKENTVKKGNTICCVHNCDAKSRSHGLCDKHLYDWQKGKIQLHPEKHITWEEHKQEPEFKNRSAARKKRVGETSSEDRSISTSKTLLSSKSSSDISVLSLLKVKLSECKSILSTLDMLGMGAKAKEEIQAHLGDWVK
jgi:hypothetical protein